MASGGRATAREIVIPKNAPKYFLDAVKDIGLQEWVLNGKKRVSNPVVERFIEKVQGKPLNAIKTPWCAYYIGAKLAYAGYSHTKSGMARSYIKYGKKVAKKDWKVGDIVVTWRGKHDDNVTGHVGFLAAWDDRGFTLLGGNQGDKVCYQDFPYTRNGEDLILAVVRPKSILSEPGVGEGVGVTGNETAVRPMVDNLIPDPEPTSKLDKATDALQTVKDPLEQIANLKPWIMGLLTAVTIALALLAVYRIYYKE